MKQYELDNSNKYCVFSCLGQFYGLPATAVRNVAPRPKLTHVPTSCDAMAGLAYVHREFLAVFSLGAVLQDNGRANREEQHMLVVSTPAAPPWSLLVDAVETLASLEVALNGSAEDQHSFASVCIGSATMGDRFVTVLDPERLHALLGGQLANGWNKLKQEMANHEGLSRDADRELIETN